MQTFWTLLGLLGQSEECMDQNGLCTSLRAMSRLAWRPASGWWLLETKVTLLQGRLKNPE